MKLYKNKENILKIAFSLIFAITLAIFAIIDRYLYDLEGTGLCIHKKLYCPDNSMVERTATER
jgi:hypothetical protein